MFFRARLILLSIEVNQRCQRTAKLFMAHFLQTNLHADNAACVSKNKLDTQFVET